MKEMDFSERITELRTDHTLATYTIFTRVSFDIGNKIF